MEKQGYTHVALVLDASGSMESVRGSTIATMRKFFDSLKSEEDKTVIDLWQFDDRVLHVLDGIDIDSGSSAAIENYTTGGCTALYDAICTGIDGLGRKFAAMSENERPDAVVFAILTDGFENASRLFSVEDVRGRITHQTEKYSWMFRFLAANQNAVLAGRDFGLEAKDCLDIEATDEGIERACRGLVSMCCDMARPIARSRRAMKKRHIAF